MKQSAFTRKGIPRALDPGSTVSSMNFEVTRSRDVVPAAVPILTIHSVGAATSPVGVGYSNRETYIQTKQTKQPISQISLVTSSTPDMLTDETPRVSSNTPRVSSSISYKQALIDGVRTVRHRSRSVSSVVSSTVRATSKRSIRLENMRLVASFLASLNWSHTRSSSATDNVNSDEGDLNLKRIHSIQLDDGWILPVRCRGLKSILNKNQDTTPNNSTSNTGDTETVMHTHTTCSWNRFIIATQLRIQQKELKSVMGVAHMLNQMFTVEIPEFINTLKYNKNKSLIKTKDILMRHTQQQISAVIPQTWDTASKHIKSIHCLTFHDGAMTILSDDALNMISDRKSVRAVRRMLKIEKPKLDLWSKSVGTDIIYIETL
jgi:hypothetical protein